MRIEPAILCLMLAVPAHGGDMVDCTERPAAGRWVYRIVDARKCWFPAGSLRRGEEKPREELRWPQVEVPPVSIMVPEPSIEPDVIIPPTAPMSEFERRWRGAVEGWDHRE